MVQKDLKCEQSDLAATHHSEGSFQMKQLSSLKMLIAILLLANVHMKANAETEGEKSRGELLYSTHCIACHTTHVHWREQRLAQDWASLKKQVGRWQSNTALGWSDEDIEAVSKYLNALYYHFPGEVPEKSISLRKPAVHQRRQ
jgi:mono/diheme cytochrome c family protein